MSNDNELPEGMGSGGNYSESSFETWKLPAADGSVIIRPFPPMKSLQKRRGLGLYYKTHYGWSGRDPKDPTKSRARPFLCLEEKENGKIVVACPACDLRKQRQDKIDAIKLLGKEKGKTQEQIKKACEPHNKWLYDHGCDGKARIPGLNKKGQIGIFMAPWGAYKSFTEKLKELQQKGKDGAGVKGMYFEFIRSGKASRDSDRCEIAKIEVEVDGETLEKDDVHVLTRDLAQQAVDNIPDLTELRDKIRYPLEKIQELCALTADADGAFDPDEVDRILGERKGSKKAAAPAAAAEDEGGDDWSGDDTISSPKADTGSKASAQAGSTPAAASTKTPNSPGADNADEDFGAEEEAPKPKTVAKPAGATVKSKVEPKPVEEGLDDIFS